MVTKTDIMYFLEEEGIKHDDKVTIHCSLRSIGEIENGADGLIDAFSDYLNEGLFIVPTLVIPHHVEFTFLFNEIIQYIAFFTLISQYNDSLIPLRYG